MILVVHVGDIVVIGNNPKEIEALKAFLASKLKIKDLGRLNYFLGMEIVKVSHGLVLTQRKFVVDLFKEFHYVTVPASKWPLGPLFKGDPAKNSLANATSYRKFVGTLNYLTNTRPNIAFSVQYLSQFL